ncbi:MAG: TIGR02594 family protein [Polymorphobacter sp.]
MDRMTAKMLQTDLIAAGFNPGAIDGAAGPQTRAALRAFQAAHGLVPDGIAGPRTRAMLGKTLPWMRQAGQLLGTRERAGAADNPAILGWARALDLAYAGDSVPWCGLFVAHCLASALPGVVLQATPLWARSWTRFGAAVPPMPGAIMVFWRGARGAGSGHVGFHAGESADAYHILGGNQSDGVSLAWLGKDRLLAARWPAGGVPVTAQPAQGLLSPGLLSVNEA